MAQAIGKFGGHGTSQFPVPGSDIAVFAYIVAKVVKLEFTGVHAVNQLPVAAAQCREEVYVVLVLVAQLMGIVENQPTVVGKPRHTFRNAESVCVLAVAYFTGFSGAGHILRTVGKQFYH